jgi:uncharacterized protein DUF5681
MTKPGDKNNFEIGYGRPPRHSRFATGQSGNPRGRQKGVRNLANDVKRTLEVPVRLTDQGKTRRVSTQEAVLLRLREKALKGDARAIDRLVDLARTYNFDEAGSGTEQPISTEDQAILDAYAEEILARARQANRGD